MILNERKKSLNLRSFAANNIVALDYGRDTNRFRRVFFLLIHANHTSVRAHKHFGTAGNFRRQCEREVNFCAGSQDLSAW